MTLKASIGALTLAWLAIGPALAQGTGGAAAPGPDGAGFTNHKAMMLANIDQRAAALATLRSCVSAAADHQAIRVCEEQHRAATHALRPPR